LRNSPVWLVLSRHAAEMEKIASILYKIETWEIFFSKIITLCYVKFV